MHKDPKLHPMVNITHVLSQILSSAAINRATPQNMPKLLHFPQECNHPNCCNFSKLSLRVAAAPLALPKIVLLLLVFSVVIICIRPSLDKGRSQCYLKLVYV